MAVICRIEGWPLSSPMHPRERESLEELLARLTRELAWEVAVPAASPEGQEGHPFLSFQIVAPLAEDEQTRWRELCQCVALAMRMSQTRPTWLWTVRDDGGLLAGGMFAPELCAWRAIFAQHPDPDPSWSAHGIDKKRKFDAAIRQHLAAAMGDDFVRMGIPPADDVDETAGSADPGASSVVLFDYEPPPGWMQSAGSSLCAVGRSMVQLDARRRSGRLLLKGRLEIGNPSALELAGVRVQVRLRSREGALLAVVEDELRPLPAGTVRIATIEVEVGLGGQAANSIDIGCEALLAKTVALTPTIVEV